MNIFKAIIGIIFLLISVFSFMDYCSRPSNPELSLNKDVFTNRIYIENKDDGKTAAIAIGIVSALIGLFALTKIKIGNTPPPLVKKENEKTYEVVGPGMVRKENRDYKPGEKVFLNQEEANNLQDKVKLVE